MGRLHANVEHVDHGFENGFREFSRLKKAPEKLFNTGFQNLRPFDVVRYEHITKELYINKIYDL